MLRLLRTGTPIPVTAANLHLLAAPPAVWCIMSYALDEDARQGLEEDDLLDDAEVDTLVREAIAQALGETQFKHDMVTQWTNGIIEGCLKRLSVLAKPFKYVVTCSLSQKVQRRPKASLTPHCSATTYCAYCCLRRHTLSWYMRRSGRACTLHAQSGGTTKPMATWRSSGKTRPSLSWQQSTGWQCKETILLADMHDRHPLLALIGKGIIPILSGHLS